MNFRATTIKFCLPSCGTIHFSARLRCVCEDGWANALVHSRMSLLIHKATEFACPPHCQPRPRSRLVAGEGRQFDYGLKVCALFRTPTVEGALEVQMQGALEHLSLRWARLTLSQVSRFLSIATCFHLVGSVTRYENLPCSSCRRRSRNRNSSLSPPVATPTAGGVPRRLHGQRSWRRQRFSDVAEVFVISTRIQHFGRALRSGTEHEFGAGDA